MAWCVCMIYILVEKTPFAPHPQGGSSHHSFLNRFIQFRYTAISVVKSVDSIGVSDQPDYNQQDHWTPLPAIRETLLSALTHRDYDQSGSRTPTTIFTSMASIASPRAEQSASSRTAAMNPSHPHCCRRSRSHIFVTSSSSISIAHPTVFARIPGSQAGPYLSIHRGSWAKSATDGNVGSLRNSEGFEGRRDAPRHTPTPSRHSGRRRSRSIARTRAR